MCHYVTDCFMTKSNIYKKAKKEKKTKSYMRFSFSKIFRRLKQKVMGQNVLIFNLELRPIMVVSEISTK